ncbi:MAG TPA: hypothetical protein VMZ91_03785 [Candidatus Paceibacterota bacterium]|nr:hypothetical protein [Candidatus Paceibacterota bacterium]
MELSGFTKLSKKSISKELEEYIKKTEEKTGRPALIINNPDEKSWPYGMEIYKSLGFLKYFDFDNESKKVINEYLELFQKRYPQQYEKAIKTKEIIFENDIFKAEGFRNAIKKCLDLSFWSIPNIEIITTSQALQLLPQAE